MEDVSILSLLGRLVVSLAIVLGLMALIARVLRNRTMPGIGRATAPAGTLQIAARQPLSRGASLAVVRAGDRVLVVGVTDASVTLLGELDPSTLDVDDELAAPPVIGAASLRTFFETVRERTVRRP